MQAGWIPRKNKACWGTHREASQAGGDSRAEGTASAWWVQGDQCGWGGVSVRVQAV